MTPITITEGETSKFNLLDSISGLVEQRMGFVDVDISFDEISARHQDDETFGTFSTYSEEDTFQSYDVSRTSSCSMSASSASYSQVTETTASTPLGRRKNRHQRHNMSMADDASKSLKSIAEEQLETVDVNVGKYRSRSSGLPPKPRKLPSKEKRVVVIDDDLSAFSSIQASTLSDCVDLDRVRSSRDKKAEQAMSYDRTMRARNRSPTSLPRSSASDFNTRRRKTRLTPTNTLAQEMQRRLNGVNSRHDDKPAQTDEMEPRVCSPNTGTLALKKRSTFTQDSLEVEYATEGCTMRAEPNEQRRREDPPSSLESEEESTKLEKEECPEVAQMPTEEVDNTTTVRIDESHQAVEISGPSSDCSVFDDVDDDTEDETEVVETPVKVISSPVDSVTTFEKSAVGSTAEKSSASPTGVEDFPTTQKPNPLNAIQSFMDFLACRIPKKGSNLRTETKAVIEVGDVSDIPKDISSIPVIASRTMESIGELTATTYEMKVNITRCMKELDIAEQEVFGKLGKSGILGDQGGIDPSASFHTVSGENYFEEYRFQPTPTEEAELAAQAKQTAMTMGPLRCPKEVNMPIPEHEINTVSTYGRLAEC